MYSLDIETLISVLQNRQIQGFLEADLATGVVSGPLKGGFVKVELKEGKIASVSIKDANGRILYQGQEALSKVRKLVLTWQLTETLSKSLDKETRTDPAFSVQRFPALNQTKPAKNAFSWPVDRSTAPYINEFVPIRRQDLPSARLRYLSRFARSIYALVNGANSTQRIADLLSQPVDVVYRELLALQEEQFIGMGDNRML